MIETTATFRRPLRCLLLALVIDVLPALFFIHAILTYEYEQKDVDLERIIFLLVVPLFIGGNFLLILILYRIVSGDGLPWYITLMLPVGVCLLAYPALYIGAHITTGIPLRFPEDEFTAMWICTLSGWGIATLAGTLITAFSLLRQQPRR